MKAREVVAVAVVGVASLLFLSLAQGLTNWALGEGADARAAAAPGGADAVGVNAAPVPGGATWVTPVDAAVGSGFRTTARPGHQGVDLGAARGTRIRAASAGVVVRVRCNTDPASYGCGRDGSRQIGGCGWYVDLRHVGGIYTRYCHMGAEPLVSVGQTVAAGEVLGLVGSTGGSSGPHLHFEVRIGSEDDNQDAVNPVPFMARHGAPLGR